MILNSDSHFPLAKERGSFRWGLDLSAKDSLPLRERQKEYQRLEWV